MILLIDIGNTRLKWSIYRDGELSDSFAFVHTHGQITKYLGEVWAGISRPNSVCMASVADRSRETAVCDWVSMQWGIAVKKLYSQSHCAGVINGYLHHEQLGVDRWAAIIGAYALVRDAVLMVDSGTALTCDAVASDGRHLGGTIVPGRSIQKKILLQNTHGVSVHGDESGTVAWGRETSQCVESGILQSQVGLIERSLSMLQDQVGNHASVVITGGDAPLLLPHLRDPVVHVPDLVFKGMLHILQAQRDI